MCLTPHSFILQELVRAAFAEVNDEDRALINSSLIAFDALDLRRQVGSGAVGNNRGRIASANPTSSVRRSLRGQLERSEGRRLVAPSNHLSPSGHSHQHHAPRVKKAGVSAKTVRALIREIAICSRSVRATTIPPH